VSAANQTPPACPHLAGYDPLSPDELADPYPSFRRARDQAPVSYSETLDMWSIARQADVLQALRDTETFSSASALPRMEPPAELRDRMPAYPWGKTVLTMDGPEHRTARSVLQAPFTPRSLRQLESQIRTRSRVLLAPLEDTGQIELVRQFAYPLSLSVIGEILGIPEEKYELLERAIDGTFSLLGGGITEPDEILAVSRPIADLREYMYQLVADRRASPRDDYTSVMVQTTLPDGSLETIPNLVTHVWVLIGAGFETTANMLSLGIWSLLRNEDQWQLLKERPELVDNAVEEMLRYRTLIKRFYRTTTREIEVAGVTVPKGARVALLAASANRDPAGYDDDPDRFDISHRRQHLAFGKWKHFCVGAPLARLEMKLALETMLEMCPGARLADGQELSWRRDLRADALTSLHLTCHRAVATVAEDRA
jgi:cytochrome P450